MITTVGKLLLKNTVPKEYKEFVMENDMDKKGNSHLFNEMSKHNQGEYAKSASDLVRLGFEIATRQGSTVRLSDLVPLADKEERFAALDKQVAEVRKTVKDKRKQEDEINSLYAGFSDQINKDLVDIGIKQDKTLAKIVKAGARGSPTQYRQTVFAPIIVNDAKGKVLTDFPIRKSFAEGLTLPEYLAHTFGARSGTVATKLATADAGYFSKQLARANMVLKVEEHDCGTENGIAVSSEDKDSIGCFLAHPVLGFNRNNEITYKILNEINAKGPRELVVRSPITCEAGKHHHTGAICQLCAGRREKNSLAPIGDYIGLTASTTLGEPLAQGQLNTKHESGSARKASVASGFKLINQLANIPDAFKDKAPLSKHDGKVVEIRTAPQGGHYIDIKHANSVDEYYIGEGFDLKVKEGDEVEAGDVLSDGIINPAEVVKYKGIGEGRKYFVKAMKSAFDEGGMGGISRRNFEVIAKGLIGHVMITNPDGLGNYLPGQVVSYHAIEKDYVPRPGSILARVDQAKGKYLEKPELHYTIGTRVTSKVIDDLKKHGVESVTINSKTPDFEPDMQRLLDVPTHEQDWMHQLYSTNLEKRLVGAVNTGMTSRLKGPSPIAGLAYGVDFGKKTAEDIEIDTEEKLSFE